MQLFNTYIQYNNHERNNARGLFQKTYVVEGTVSFLPQYTWHLLPLNIIHSNEFHKKKSEWFEFYLMHADVDRFFFHYIRQLLYRKAAVFANCLSEIWQMCPVVKHQQYSGLFTAMRPCVEYIVYIACPSICSSRWENYKLWRIYIASSCILRHLHLCFPFSNPYSINQSNPDYSLAFLVTCSNIHWSEHLLE